MDIAVVIVNWNAAADTVACVKSFNSWQRIKPIIFVVDNASVDNSVEIIQRECPDINLICNLKNLGFAGGTNRGIEKALSNGNAPVMLLNNDAFITETDTIKLLKTLEENPKLGSVVPLLYDGEKKDRLISAGGKNPVKHHHTQISTLTPGASVQIVESISGTAVIIRSNVFRMTGLLDEDFFFSTELADLCMRAKQHNYACAVNTQARAYHTTSRSSNLRDTLFVYYIVRNRFIFIRNSPYKFKFMFNAFWAVYSFVLSLKLRLSGKKPTSRAVYLGLVDGLQKRFGGQNERILSICRPDLANRPEYRS